MPATRREADGAGRIAETYRDWRDAFMIRKYRGVMIGRYGSPHDTRPHGHRRSAATTDPVAS